MARMSTLGRVWIGLDLQPAGVSLWPASLFTEDSAVPPPPIQKLIVIGGGLVGLATAYKYLRAFPSSAVTILEKESALGQHQSSHNSGVLHCGLYYSPGSAKARLAVSGIREMTEFCRTHNVPHDICGKLVVATHATEIPRLQFLLDRGRQNGLTGLRWLEPHEMRQIEPNVNGVAALHVPEEGIVDYPAVCEAVKIEILNRGGTIVTGANATHLQRNSDIWTVETSAGNFQSDSLVNCAGLYSDRVSQAAGHRRQTRIVPFRGEYYKLKPDRQHLVRNLIYPVPDSQFPFLGVHFTRLIRGGIEAGPNAVLAFSREGYTKTTLNLRDLADALTFPGLWRFLRRHPRMCFQEALGSLSKKHFCRALQRLVPAVRPDDLEPGGSGVRAQAMTPEGRLVEDFHLVRGPNSLHVLNAPSPAATASLAIGGEIITQLQNN